MLQCLSNSICFVLSNFWMEKKYTNICPHTSVLYIALYLGVNCDFINSVVYKFFMLKF